MYIFQLKKCFSFLDWERNEIVCALLNDGVVKSVREIKIMPNVLMKFFY